MTDDKVLEAIKKFLVEKVAINFKLEKPPEDGVIDKKYELVNPAVYIGWIPPKNYLNDYGYDIPSLLVMEDGGDDDGNEASLNIRIGIATYDPGLTVEAPLNEIKTEINSKGYKDLLNIMQRIRIEFSKLALIGNITSLQMPIKWGMYEEQQYPYWHGWISFRASTLPLSYQNSDIEKFL